MTYSVPRFAFVGLLLLAGLCACNGLAGAPGGPGAAGQGVAGLRAQARPDATSTPDPRDLARYSSQLALSVLDFEEVDLSFIGELLAPPSNCSNAQTFSLSGNIVTVSTFPSTTCSGAAEETAAYTVAQSSPFTATFAATATAGGSNYNATGTLSVSSNTLPLSYLYEIGQPAWQSMNSSNSQRGVTLNFAGSGSVGGGQTITGASGTYAKAFSGKKAVAATGKAKIGKKTYTIAAAGTLYESATQSITIAPSGSTWEVSGGTLVKGAAIKASLVIVKNGGPGSFVYSYKNTNDPLYPQLDGTVTAKVKKLYDGDEATVPLLQSGKTIATLTIDRYGYGTITYFDSSLEYITDWTIHSKS